MNNDGGVIVSIGVVYFFSVLLSLVLLTIKVEDDGVSLHSGIQVFREATTVGMLVVAFFPVVNSVFVIWKIVLYTWLMALNVLIMIHYFLRNPPNILTKRPFYEKPIRNCSDEELSITRFYTIRSALMPIHIEVTKYNSLAIHKRDLDYTKNQILSHLKKTVKRKTTINSFEITNFSDDPMTFFGIIDDMEFKVDSSGIYEYDGNCRRYIKWEYTLRDRIML